MAEGKKSFIAYSDWKQTFDELPNEIAGELIKHIFAYVNDENPKSENYVINAVFANIKNTLKRDLDKWDSQLNQRREAGKRSAELRATKINERSISLNEKTRNPTDSVSVSVSVSDSVILLEKETKEKHIPAYEDFFNYAKEKKPLVDEFSVKAKYDSWVSNDWKDGNDKEISNWKTKLGNTLPYLKENSPKPKGLPNGITFASPIL